MNEANDWEIILEVKGGHTDKFNFLINKYSNRLFQFLYARLKNKEDIEDILLHVHVRRPRVGVQLSIAHINACQAEL